MAANPKIISAMHSVPKEEVRFDIKQRIQNLLIKIFHGHEDFLGRTPD